MSILVNPEHETDSEKERMYAIKPFQSSMEKSKRFDWNKEVILSPNAIEFLSMLVGRYLPEWEVDMCKKLLEVLKEKEN